jgi:hypothetical protein
MPAYNFKKQFIAPIRSGEKRTTIRPYRVSRPTRVGDTLYLFTGQRTKHCERIGDYECIGVEPIRIDPIHWTVHLNGSEVCIVEIWNMAKSDGFQEISQFFEFFLKVYGTDMPKMELISWDPSRAFENPSNYVKETELPEHTPIFTTT